MSDEMSQRERDAAVITKMRKAVDDRSRSSWGGEWALDQWLAPDAPAAYSSFVYSALRTLDRVTAERDAYKAAALRISREKQVEIDLLTSALNADLNESDGAK